MLIKIKDIYLKIENIIWFSNNTNSLFPRLNKKVYYANKLNTINDFSISHMYSLSKLNNYENNDIKLKLLNLGTFYQIDNNFLINYKFIDSMQIHKENNYYKLIINFKINDFRDNIYYTNKNKEELIKMADEITKLTNIL